LGQLHKSTINQWNFCKFGDGDKELIICQHSISITQLGKYMQNARLFLPSLAADIDREQLIKLIRGTPFVFQYVVAALSTAEEGKILDGAIVDNIASGSLISAYHTCRHFIATNEAALEKALEIYPGSTDGSSSIELAGFDLLLSRNGEGAGYFDRKLGAYGERLQAAARELGSCELVEGSDGFVHFEGGKSLPEAKNWKKGDTDLSVFADTDVYVCGGDLPETLRRVDIDFEMTAVAESVGLPLSGGDWSALLVEVADGDFKHVFATTSSRPHLDRAEYLPVRINGVNTSYMLSQEAEEAATQAKNLTQDRG
jgi:hypothetical protein